MKRSAIFSPCRTWRYVLERCWDEALPTLNVIALNPSTADEELDDPTVRRCLGFARDWGFGRLLVTNLFAVRATDPRVLRQVPDPIGSENDRYIEWAARQASLVLACWGNHGALNERASDVWPVLCNRTAEVRHFGLTKTGQPKHPLYLPSTAQTVLL